MRLDDVSLLSLQTSYMRRDPTTAALCAALDGQFRELSEDIRAVLIYARVDCLDDPVLDELAWQMHVDGYDALAGLAEKRRMIKGSIQVHKYKGTVYAIKRILADVFGESAQVLEWFDYGGKPYRFKVNVYCSERGANAADILRAEQLIHAAKNVRSVLESIVLILFSRCELRVASGIAGADVGTVWPSFQFGGGARLLAACLSADRVTIWPLEAAEGG